MEFKKVFYPILLGLILFSGLYVLAGGSVNTSATNVTISSILPHADSGETGAVYDVVHKNGTVARYNFTIVLSDSTANISIINITTDYNLTWAVPNNLDVNGTSFNASFGGLLGVDGHFNATNLSISDYDVHVTNLTDADADGYDAEQQWDSLMFNLTGNNQSDVVVSFNVTARVSDADSDYRVTGGRNVDLLAMNWRIGINQSNGTVTHVNLTTYVDAAPPRITELNFTDGNATIYNLTAATYFMPTGARATLNESGTARLQNGTVTVYMTVKETHIKGVNMYYTCNSSSDDNDGLGNASLATYYSNVSLSTSDTVSPYLYTGDLDIASCISTTGVVGQNRTTVFFQINDKVGWSKNTTYYDSVDDNGAQLDASHPFSFIINNNSIPIIREINVSDIVNGGEGSNTLTRVGTGKLTGTSGFVITESNVTINVEVVGQDLTNATLFYIVADTVNYSTTKDETFYTIGKRTSMNCSDMNATSPDPDGRLLMYQGTILDGWLNDTNQNTTVNFMIIVNSSGNDYVAKYKGAFLVDGVAPSATITAPADTTVGVQNTIDYTCGGSDGTAGSGIASCKLLVTKPDSTVVSYTSTTCAEQTIPATETGVGGTYTVGCQVTDGVGNVGTATTKTFLVLHSAGGGAATGGGTGGAAVPSVDIDLTTAESASVTGYQGNSKTFTFGGSSHTITITSVSETSVTVTIESNPMVVTLNVGETKKVDLNSDGTDDLELTLKSVSTAGRADVEMKKLSEGAAILVEEEKAAAAGEQPAEEAAEEAAGEEVVTEEEGLSTGVIVTIIAVIVIIGIVAYVLIRRRS